jgi:hypothetical protein
VIEASERIGKGPEAFPLVEDLSRSQTHAENRKADIV